MSVCGTKSHDKHTHGPMLFFHSFYFHILLSARRTHSVRLFSSYLIASRIRALEPSSNVAKRDVCLWRTQNISSIQLRKHKRVDQNKLFAFFNSRAQASLRVVALLLPLRRIVFSVDLCGLAIAWHLNTLFTIAFWHHKQANFSLHVVERWTWIRCAPPFDCAKN